MERDYADVRTAEVALCSTSPGLVGINDEVGILALCRRRHNHQLRHAHAVELLHEGIPLPLIQRQLGHSYLSTTGTYLQGIDSEEIISAVHARRAPMMHASAGFQL